MHFTALLQHNYYCMHILSKRGNAHFQIILVIETENYHQ